MSALIRLLASIGFVVGLGMAAVLHWARSIVDDGWTLYAPSGDKLQFPMHHPGWWPTLLVFPTLGVIAGALVGFGLARLGWTMVRGGKSPDSRA